MNTFLEQFGKKVSQTGQDAMKKTKELAEIAKLNTQINEEEKRLNKIYMNLGKLYYQLNGANPELEYQDICLAIKGSIRNINQFQLMIDELKGIKRCKTCGTEMPDTSSYCQSCGSKLNVQEEKVVIIICEQCGMENGAKATSCVRCGKPL